MKSLVIKEIKARQVYDSRANPTVEVDVFLEDGTMGRGTVPSGASTGRFEALELRDKDINRLNGKSVMLAVNNVNNIIAPEIIGMNIFDQISIDKKLITLDNTENKSNLGANAILGVSIAAAWAGANALQMPLFRYLGGSNARVIPTPMIQIIGGGTHANGAIDLQDFLVIPATTVSFEHAYEMVVNVYNATKKVFDKYGKPLSIADEGGFWPTDFAENEDGLKLLVEGIEQAGYTPGKDIHIAIDFASSEFFDEATEQYVLQTDGVTLSREEFVDYICRLVKNYPIVSIEDGMSEIDWKGSKLLTQRLGKKVQLIGDDLFTTNIQRINRGVESNICNSVLIKMNQIGTISETLDAIEFTKNAGYLPVVSARSGETEDVTITHLAIATNAGQLKVGSVARTERTAKWNEAIRIEQLLSDDAIYLGDTIFDRLR